MAVAWTAHRFSGGLLVLDLTNTVVLRGDAERTFDRFDDPGELPRFAEAATVFRNEELRGVTLECAEPERCLPAVIALRESADMLFRHHARYHGLPAPMLAGLLAACTPLLAGEGTVFAQTDAAFGLAGTRVSLGAAVAWSALTLVSGHAQQRLRICGNCGWLFVDRSRNGSRVWCDMAVCGNRRKAQRHYHRSRETRERRHA